MPKRLKRFAEESSHGLSDYARQIWLAGLGAMSVTQEEGGKFFDNLVAKGRDVEAQRIKGAEDRIKDARTQVGGTVNRLEQVFQDRVARTLNGLGVPTEDDIQILAQRVESLSDSIQTLVQEENAARDNAVRDKPPTP